MNDRKPAKLVAALTIAMLTSACTAELESGGAPYVPVDDGGVADEPVVDWLFEGAADEPTASDPDAEFGESSEGLRAAQCPSGTLRSPEGYCVSGHVCISTKWNERGRQLIPDPHCNTPVCGYVDAPYRAAGVHFGRLDYRRYSAPPRHQRIALGYICPNNRPCNEYPEPSGVVTERVTGRFAGGRYADGTPAQPILYHAAEYGFDSYLPSQLEVHVRIAATAPIGKRDYIRTVTLESLGYCSSEARAVRVPRAGVVPLLAGAALTRARDNVAPGAIAIGIIAVGGQLLIPIVRPSMERQIARIRSGLESLTGGEFVREFEEGVTLPYADAVDIAVAHPIDYRGLRRSNYPTIDQRTWDRLAEKGQCHPDSYIRNNNLQETYCHRGACRPRESCRQMRARISNIANCIYYRQQVNNCFLTDPNSGHAQQIAEQIASLENCRARLAQCTPP